MTTVAGKSKFVDQNTGQAGERLPLAPPTTFFRFRPPLCHDEKYTEQTYFLYGILYPQGKVKNIFRKKAA